MTLGERISALRSARGLSQGDLAEKLGVSRQSVSKWETDTSIPDLNRLIELSELFRISLDELVKGEAPSCDVSPQGEDAAPAQTVIVQKGIGTQKIVGFILLAIGLLCCVLAFMLGRGLLLIGGYILLCSLICLKTKQHAGLVIGWITILLVLLLAPYFTGIRVFAVLRPSYYQNGFSANQFLTILFWLLGMLLAFLTVRINRKK